MSDVFPPIKEKVDVMVAMGYCSSVSENGTTYVSVLLSNGEVVTDSASIEDDPEYDSNTGTTIAINKIKNKLIKKLEEEAK